MLSPRVFAIPAVYFGLTTAGPLALRQEECGGDWECAPIVDTIPTCARPCIADGTAQVGCGADDFVCRCQNKSRISDLVTSCVLSSCEIDDAIKTVQGTDFLCSCVSKNGGPQPACPPASSSSVDVPAPSSASPPPASSVVPPVSSAPAPPASSAPASPSSAPEPPSYSAGPVPSESAPAPPASSSAAAPVPSCSAAPSAPAPAPAGPWKCQTLADAVHDCALPCIADGAASVGCDASDYTCRCDNAAAISDAATSCVISACGIPTALEVRQQTTDLCTCVAANPPPSGDGQEAPATPAPVESGCPPPPSPPTTTSGSEPGYPTEPPKDGGNGDEEPQPSATYPTTPEPSTPVEEEPPVVTAGATKIIGSGAAALLALAFAL